MKTYIPAAIAAALATIAVQRSLNTTAAIFTAAIFFAFAALSTMPNPKRK